MPLDSQELSEMRFMLSALFMASHIVAGKIWATRDDLVDASVTDADKLIARAAPTSKSKR